MDDDERTDRGREREREGRQKKEEEFILAVCLSLFLPLLSLSSRQSHHHISLCCWGRRRRESRIFALYPSHTTMHARAELCVYCRQTETRDKVSWTGRRQNHVAWRWQYYYVLPFLLLLHTMAPGAPDYVGLPRRRRRS